MGVAQIYDHGPVAQHVSARLEARLHGLRAAVGIVGPDHIIHGGFRLIEESAIDQFPVGLFVAQIDLQYALEPGIHRRYHGTIPAAPGKSHVHGLFRIDLRQTPQQGMGKDQIGDRHHVRWRDIAVRLPAPVGRQGDTFTTGTPQVVFVLAPDGGQGFIPVPVRRDHGITVRDPELYCPGERSPAASVCQHDPGETAFRCRTFRESDVCEKSGNAALFRDAIVNDRLHAGLLTAFIGFGAVCGRILKRCKVPVPFRAVFIESGAHKSSP